MAFAGGLGDFGRLGLHNGERETPGTNQGVVVPVVYIQADGIVAFLEAVVLGRFRCRHTRELDVRIRKVIGDLAAVKLGDGRVQRNGCQRAPIGFGAHRYPIVTFYLPAKVYLGGSACSWFDQLHGGLVLVRQVIAEVGRIRRSERYIHRYLRPETCEGQKAGHEDGQGFQLFYHAKRCFRSCIGT